MKKILSVSLWVSLSANVLAQGQIAIDNLSGFGGSHATSFGLFFDEVENPYTNATINATILGGSSPGSLSPIVTLSGANALVFIVEGIYADPTGGIYPVPNVPKNSNAVLQVLAWIGNALTFAAASNFEQFHPWSGTNWVADPATFTFVNQTGGGGTPPKLPQTLDGMPAMSLIPEPSSASLIALGLIALRVFSSSRVKSGSTGQPMVRPRIDGLSNLL